MTPTAIDVEYLDEYKLLITFNNNEMRILDMMLFLSEPYWVSIAPLPIFKTAKADGIGISWCNGVDLSPEDAYLFSKPIN
jgi:hypothetical protein